MGTGVEAGSGASKMPSPPQMVGGVPETAREAAEGAALEATVEKLRAERAAAKAAREAERALQQENLR
jgi:hypothetical protein